LKTMAILAAFKHFELAVRELLSQTDNEKDIVDGVRPLLKELLTVEGLVPEKYRKPSQDKYGQYLLYKPEDEVFSIVAFVWGPGQVAPVHDHLVWGVVGILEGAIEEIRYRRLDDGLDPNRAIIEEVDSVTAVKGDITFVYPPEADIHSVSNPFNQLAITIHIYGTDIGKQERHIHDLETGAVKQVITKHTNEYPVYA
jgi:predicted metal-dependent enzyme (double-stranded beta helix superfamily)